MATEAEIGNLAKLADVEDLRPSDFYDLVHDLKSGEAGKINSRGIESQLDYIIDCLGEEGARKAVQDVARKIAGDGD